MFINSCVRVKRLRVVYIGCVELSYQLLSETIKRHDVVGVISKLTPYDGHYLQTLAIMNGIPFQPASYLSSKGLWVDWIKSLKADCIYCFGWHDLIPKEVLECVPYVVGFHPAMLPKNRGCNPITWALALGLKETGSTFFKMTSKIDAGDIISQKKVKIKRSDNAQSLYHRIVEVARTQIKDLDGNGVPQRGLANYWRRRTDADSCIDWRMSADSIYNLVRALAPPYCGAHYIKDGKKIKVSRVKIVRVPRNLTPGSLFKNAIVCGKDGLCVS